MAQFSYLSLLSLSIGLALQPSDADSPVSRVKQDLFKEYDPKLIPESDGTLLVAIGIDIVKLTNYEENIGGPSAKIALKIHEMWTNPKFKWDPVNYEGVDSFVVEPKSVWNPDFIQLTTMEGIPETPLTGPDDRVTIYSEGSVDRTFWTRTKIPCQFPSKSKKDNEFTLDCTLVYGSPTIDIKKLTFGFDSNMSMLSDTTQSGAASGAFISSIDSTERQNFTYDCCPGEYYSRLTLTMHLSKFKPTKPEAFFGPIVLPCIVFSLLILLQFLIPPNIGERVVYGILILIFMMLYGYFVSDFTSRGPGDGFWALPSVYIFCLILGAAAALTNTCLVVNFYHTKHNALMHDMVKKLFLRYLPRAMCMRNAFDDVERRMFDKRQSTKRRRVSDSAAVEAAYGGGSSDAQRPLLSSPVPPAAAAVASDTRAVSASNTAGGAAGAPQTPARWSPAFIQTAWLREIARDVRDLTHSLNVRLAETRGSPQWTYAAEVLNRFGLITVGAYLLLCHFVAIIVYCCSN